MQKNTNDEDPNPTFEGALPPIGDDEPFTEWERVVFYHLRERDELSCIFCDSKRLTNKGQGGNTHQGGFKTLQVLCLDCKSTGRLTEFMDYAGLHREIHEYKNVYDIKQAEGLKDKAKAKSKKEKVQTKLKFGNSQQVSENYEKSGTSKRPRTTNDTNEIIENDFDAMQIALSDVETVASDKSSISSIQNNNTANVIAVLSKQIAEQAALIKSLQQTIVELNARLAKNEEATKKKSVTIQEPSSSRKNAVNTAAEEPSVGPSYAEAAKAPKKKNNPPKRMTKDFMSRLATKLREEAAPPLEFGRIHLRVNNNRQMKGLRHGQARKVVELMFQQMGIRNKVARFSLIGRSIVELYYPMQYGAKEDILRKIQQGGAKVVEDFDPLKQPEFSSRSTEDFEELIVNRISTMINKAYTPRNLKAAMLKDLPDRLIAEIENRTRTSVTKSGPVEVNVRELLGSQTPSASMQVDEPAQGDSTPCE